MTSVRHLLWILPVAAFSSAAFAQVIGSPSGSAAPGASTGGATAPGIRAVPNNALPPITGSITPGITTPAPGIPSTTPGIPLGTPGIPSRTPRLGTTTPGFGTAPGFGAAQGFSTAPGFSSGPAADSFIELSPPFVATPSSPNLVRTCPSGMTFC